MESIGDDAPVGVPVTSALDRYLHWLARWQRAVFFPESDSAAVEASWEMLSFSSIAERGNLSSNTALDPVLVAEARLQQQAAESLRRTGAGQRISAVEFDQVMTSFTHFASLLRQFEQSQSLAHAGVDLLTGLKNRAVMYDELLREANRFNRNQQVFSIAVCDLDGLALITESYGPNASECVLQAIAAAIGRALRVFDDAFRIGDDEFLICLKDCDLLDSAIVAERIRRSIEQLPIVLSDGTVIHTTASFGVASIAPQRAIEDLLDEAARAVARAKQTGGNLVAQALAAAAGLPGMIDISEGSLV